MKRIVILGMVLVLMLASLGGCFIPVEGRGGGGGHDRDGGHQRDGGHNRGGR